MLVLATDLDGTFLGGSLGDRNRLYQWIRSRGGQVLLIFVTGRAPDNIKPLLADPAIPDPQYVIANVGATILHGDTLEPVEPLDSELASRWIGERSVLAAIPPGLDLERQQQAQQRRCSFYTEDPRAVEAVRSAVAPLGCEVLYSGNRYLDVMAAGVNKGAALKMLVRHLDLRPADILVAGDSLNDLSMFSGTAFRGVVVGDSEPALSERLKDRPGLYRAKTPGAGGVLEAISGLGVLGHGRAVQAPRGDAELVVVYHRQPFEETRQNGEWTRSAPGSPNGIIPTLLGLFRNGRRGAWVAWSACGERPGRFEHRVAFDRDEFSNLVVSRLLLDREEVELFYHKFSKQALWPVLHGFIERASFDHRHWQHFIDINQRFGARAAEEAAENALVWIHDYNLWLVPEYLRALRPDLRIAFFHHTPFPPGDIFNVIPWSGDIIASLLKCDYVGFHVPRYSENFVDAVRSHYSPAMRMRRKRDRRFAGSGSALSVDRATAEIDCGDRTIYLGVHPVGLDLRRIGKSLDSPGFESGLRRLKKDLSGQKVVVCAERLDYMKGPLQKLLAYERFLSQYPVWREKVSFINICTPPSAGMSVYDELQCRVEQVVGRINGRFATSGWSPVTYMFRHVEFAELAAYLALADVAWITPLRDGLNLVAKEYVAVRGRFERTGVLVISEFAGSSVELIGALPTNPYDTTEMANTLQQALVMKPEEQAARMEKLRGIVRRYDVEHWAREFIRNASRGLDLDLYEQLRQEAIAGAGGAENVALIR